MPAVISNTRTTTRRLAEFGRRIFLVPKTAKSKSIPKEDSTPFLAARRASHVPASTYVDSDSDSSLADARDFSPPPTTAPVERPTTVAQDVLATSEDDSNWDGELLWPKPAFVGTNYAHPDPMEDIGGHPDPIEESWRVADHLEALLHAGEANVRYRLYAGRCTPPSPVATTAVEAVKSGPAFSRSPAPISALAPAAGSLYADPAVVAITEPAKAATTTVVAPYTTAIGTGMDCALDSLARRIVGGIPSRRARPVGEREMNHVVTRVGHLTVDPSSPTEMDALVNVFGAADVDGMQLDVPKPWGIQFNNEGYALGKRGRSPSTEGYDTGSDSDAGYASDEDGDDASSSEEDGPGPAKRAKIFGGPVPVGNWFAA